MHNYYEFFAGGGMARLGLGPSWTCLFANDIDKKKAASYRRHFGDDHLTVDDVNEIELADLPGRVALAWASFPCQDLSLAGSGGGLDAERSGTFWPFWELMRGLVKQSRAPKLIVLENVCGAITSNEGRDFVEIGRAITKLGYRFGAIVIDAVHFVPQSRPRLFFVAVAPNVRVPAGLVRPDPSAVWHPRNLIEAKFGLPKAPQKNWIWWNLPSPTPRETVFADIVEDKPTGVDWHTRSETQQLLSMMSPLNLSKVREAQETGGRKVGGLYRRTRNGVQRAEVRFDDVAGCLRTPRGGSSRQTILVVEAGSIRSRLLSPREAARLMGLPDDYALPSNYNDAYHLAGDGVVVPVVRHLAQNILEPTLAANRPAKAAAA